jgi:hypothetical protein
MVTRLLCVLPILLPTQAQAYETLATTHPVGRRRLSRSLWDAIHARNGPRPADDAPNEECHSRVPEDHVRRGDKRCADEPEHVNAAPVMVLATAPRRAAQRRFARSRSMAIAVRSSATTKAMLKCDPRREQLLHDALTTGYDTLLLLERNSKEGQYTRQQIQPPP